MTLSIAARRSRERVLRMAWEVERCGRRSIPVGSAHFFPYHFRGWLRRYIGGARTIGLEGPSTRTRCARSASRARARLVLHWTTRSTRLRRPDPPLARHPSAPLGVNESVGIDCRPRRGVVRNERRGLEPWMAFLATWTRYRNSSGWTYTLDVDAEQMPGRSARTSAFRDDRGADRGAQRFPLERIVSFLARGAGRGTAGSTSAATSTATSTAWSCGARLSDLLRVDRRAAGPDPRRPHGARSDAGAAVAFVGVIHCHGVIALLRDEGFTITHLAGAERDRL